MVTAILHLVEQDGTTLPPRRVTIVGPCSHHRDGGCIEVATEYGDTMFCHPSELAPDVSGD